MVFANASGYDEKRQLYDYHPARKADVRGWGPEIHKKRACLPAKSAQFDLVAARLAAVGKAQIAAGAWLWQRVFGVAGSGGSYYTSAESKFPVIRGSWARLRTGDGRRIFPEHTEKSGFWRQGRISRASGAP